MIASPANAGVNVAEEFDKAQLWIALHPERQFTRRFFERWLTRADRKVNGKGHTNGKPFKRMTGMDRMEPGEEEAKRIADEAVARILREQKPMGNRLRVLYQCILRSGDGR